SGELVVENARKDFSGFIEIQAPGYAPVLHQLAGPAFQSEIQVGFWVISAKELQDIAGPGFEPTLGTLILSTMDCDAYPAPGVSFSIASGKDPVYFGST